MLGSHRHLATPSVAMAEHRIPILSLTSSKMAHNSRQIARSTSPIRLMPGMRL